MNSGIAYKGDVYLRRWENGVLNKQVIGPVGGTKLTLKANAEVKERLGKGRDNFGLVVGSITINQPTDVALGFNEVDPQVFAMLFMGTSAALNDAGGSVTGESITLVQDAWVKTAQRNISTSAITSLTLGVDFIEHPRMGAIMAKTPGAVGVQSVDYTYSGITGTRVSSSVGGKIEVEIVFDGVNLESESDAYVRVPKATLIPDADIDLLSGDYIDTEMSGKAIKIPSETGDVIFDDGVVYG